MSAASQIAAAAGPGIGGGIGAWAGLRFLRWAIEFVCKRLDLRSARMDEREAALERKFNDRLRHVEDELELYREALMFLVNAVADKDPANPALREVTQILRQVYRPPERAADDLDHLINKLDGEPGTRKRRA